MSQSIMESARFSRDVTVFAVLIMLTSTFSLNSQAEGDGPPLPVHTIEGGGGAAITPIAYLVNPGTGENWYGKPAIAFTHLDLKDKTLDTFSITNTFFKRLELGYAAGSLDLGTLPTDLFNATGARITDDLIVHNLSARFLAIEENKFNSLTPAITLTAHYKYNDEIEAIDNRLGGALSGLGYDSEDGVDFTLTASKAWPEAFLGQTLITTLGLRYTEAIWNGYLGYSDDYHMTAEANVVMTLPYNMFIAYEYRGMPDAIGELGALVREETDWHALDLGWMPNDQLSLVLFYGNVGNLVNEKHVDAAWALQAKFEF